MIVAKTGHPWVLGLIWAVPWAVSAAGAILRPEVDLLIILGLCSFAIDMIFRSWMAFAKWPKFERKRKRYRRRAAA